MADRGGTFVCRMHPNIRRLGAGVCPKCGLELVSRNGRGVLRSTASHLLQVAALLAIVTGIATAIIALLH